MALETRESTMGGGKWKVHSDEASAQTWAGVVKLPPNALVSLAAGQLGFVFSPCPIRLAVGFEAQYFQTGAASDPCP